MDLKKHWYKVAAVLILTYVLLAGLLVPLKPGVLTVEPYIIRSEAINKLAVEGYNSHYTSANGDIAVWLKLDSIQGIKANKVTVLDDTHLEVVFNISQPFPENRPTGTLMVHNEKDGTSLLPNFKLSNAKTDKTESFSGISNSVINMPAIFFTKPGWQFPFRPFLHETIRNTFFHVAIWMAMFFLATVSLVYSILELRSHNYLTDIKASSFTSITILYGLIGIATGSLWAKTAWGVFWTADVKLNMATVAILIYLAYIILRSAIQDQDQRARVSAAYNIFAYIAMIPLIFVIPRLPNTDSLHPGNGGNPALGGEDLDNALRYVFYPSIIGLILLGIWLSNLRFRVESLLNKER